jgi:hypothetical protein
MDSQISQIKFQNSKLLSKIHDVDQNNQEKINQTNQKFESKISQVYSSSKQENEKNISELKRNLTDRWVDFQSECSQH